MITPMIYLCRFGQRNRLIEISVTSEYYHQQNGISHENLKRLISQEFQLQKITNNSLIIQIWNEQYQDYIDIESFKRIPFEGRLQVLIEKNVNMNEDASSLILKNSAILFPSNTITTIAGSMTPIALQTESNVNDKSSISDFNRNSHHENDSSSSLCSIKVEPFYDQTINAISTMHPNNNLFHSQFNIIYDLLAKPADGIPIPHFPPHITAFLNGHGDANQLNALVQALYQDIVKYELYPNADELRSIVNRLVDRHPNCISVIGSIEILVRKLYYKFCNERKKYPIEFKRRQPNKRKYLLRDDDLSIMNNQQFFLDCQANVSNKLNHSSLERRVNLRTTATISSDDTGLSRQPVFKSGSSAFPLLTTSKNIEINEETKTVI